ncbi:MAG: phosphatidylinositol alpha-1,6-mannosyltransferase [Paraglaciecola sp.]|jgi:phosphatidylinositol alpha-1,6-mannosyltransferase
MRKTLLLSEIFPPVNGGSGRWFWEVYTRLPAKDIVVAAERTDLSAEFDNKSPLTTYRIPLSSSSWGLKSLSGLHYYWRVYRTVMSIIKSEKIKVIHCGRCLPEGFIGFLINKLQGIPYVCYIHGEDVETAATSRELSWIVKQALGGASKLICNSQNSAQILLENWQTDPTKTCVINPGVDAQKFKSAAIDETIKNSLGWQSRQVILTVGRLQERKGHDILIKALPSIVEKFPQVLYAIIGHGEQKSNLSALVAKLKLQDHVLFMDEISDQKMIQSYQQCDVFALPNRTVGRDIEGFGMVLVEAQACAKPVIAGDSGGTAETMVIGKSGLIIDCTNPTVLANVLITWLGDPKLCSQMGQQGRLHVEATLDWIMLTKRIKHLIDTL